MNENENITKIYNQQSDISPISKMRIITADKTKRESQYWIEHFKYKQNLLNQLDMIKNENPDKKEKTLAISQFNKEQEILSDNLYKLKQITKYSQIKLGNNFNKMKKIENNEETQKQKLKEIYVSNIIDVEEKEYEIEDFKFEVIYTKGHRNDSVTYYFKDDKMMFTGDFLFYLSVGRTDFEYGDYEEMEKSIRKIKEYPTDTIIYPGHGTKTDLMFEIRYNSFLR